MQHHANVSQFHLVDLLCSLHKYIDVCNNIPVLVYSSVQQKPE